MVSAVFHPSVAEHRAQAPAATPAAATATTDRTTCEGHRWWRGRNASSSTAMHAAPRMIRSGSSAP